MHQLPLIATPPTKRQRERHFQRREKVLGQFFTPSALATWAVEQAIRWIDHRGKALDPACGDGAFLRPLLSAGFKEVWGIDVDLILLTQCATRCGGGERLKLQQANALAVLKELQGRFDLVVTNPPFSAKYGRVNEKRLLHQFELGRGRSSEAVEALFLELCVKALKDGGVLAIVLPEGIFANIPQRRVRVWLCRHVTPLAVVSLSRKFFAAKSCVLFARKEPATLDAPVLLAHAESDEDLAGISRLWQEGKGIAKPLLSLLLSDMSPLHHLKPVQLPQTFPLRPLGELAQGLRGGATEYGAKRQFVVSGIPFLSAKTVTPFGIDLRRDERFVAPNSPMDKPSARTRIGDVLFVRVGVGCVGRTAVVLNEDETGVADDYLYILRFRSEMLPEFFALFAQTRFFRQQLENLKRGTGTVTVPQRLLKEMLVPLPPKDVQERFAFAYRNLHERYRRGESAQNLLPELIAQLENLLEGKVDVKTVH